MPAENCGVTATPVTDVLVVGAGMCGSAAARHLQEARPDLRIVLVGPDEPLMETSGVFGQHADEGRITRTVDPDPV